MTSTVIRQQTAVVVEPPPENVVPEKQTVVDQVQEEVPFFDYKAEHGKPFLADYYKLGDHWDAFNQEISLINDYVTRKIEDGDIANSVSAVRKEIEKMEKLHNLKDEERTVIKVGTLASYIKFLNETEGIKFNYYKHKDN